MGVGGGGGQPVGADRFRGRRRRGERGVRPRCVVLVSGRPRERVGNAGVGWGQGVAACSPQKVRVGIGWGTRWGTSGCAPPGMCRPAGLSRWGWGLAVAGWSAARSAGHAGGAEPSDDDAGAGVVVPGELGDGGAVAVTVGEVGGEGGGGEELVASGGGGERGAADAEGACGSGDGAVGVEGVGNLLAGEAGGSVGAAAWGDSDAAEALVETADAHPGPNHAH